MVDLSTVMLNYQRVSNQFGLANQWALGTIMGTINHDIDIISGYNHGTFLWFHWGFISTNATIMQIYDIMGTIQSIVIYWEYL